MPQNENAQGRTFSQHDEIDLRFVYHRIKGIFSSINASIRNFISAGIKRIWLVLPLFVLGIAAGTALFYKTRPVYISTLTLSSFVLSNDFCSDRIGNLAVIVKDKTPNLLAKKLKIDIATAKQIAKIRFENYDEGLKEKYKNKDTVVLGRPFKIFVSSYDNTSFDTLETALVNYLENNEYALKRKEIKKKNLSLMHEKLQNDMHQLDSLKLIVSANLLPRGTANGFVFGEPIDPVSIFKENVKMFQTDLEIKKEMELTENIQVIESFSPRDKPDSPILWKTTSACGSLFLVIGFICANILERRKNR